MISRNVNSPKRILVLSLALAMLFCAIAAALGVSVSAAEDPVSVFDDGYALNANWIWANAEVYPEQWAALRKTFTLSEVPEECFTRISADTKYWLWINGEAVIVEGQLKLGDSRYTWYYDMEDISDYLVEGENTIAVQVYYAGKVSATTVNSGVPSFLFEAQIGDTLICSDTSWKAVIDPAYEDAGIEEHGSIGESSTRYNAAKEMTDTAGNVWTDKDYDDSSWASAVVQDEKIRVNRIKNNEGGNNKVYYQDTDPRRMLVLRSIPQWYIGEINRYTADGANGTGIYDYKEIGFAPLSLPGEYVVEAEVEVGSSTEGAIGICVCVSDANNFYMPQISLKRSGSSAFDGILFKPHTMSAGSWKSSSNDLTSTDFGKTVYDPQNNVDNRFDTKHKIRIEVTANTIKTYMNGQLLGTVTDTKLAQEGSTVGFRQDLNEILRVYSFKVTDTFGKELYNANIGEKTVGSTVNEFSAIHIENSKNDAAIAKIAHNEVSRNSSGEKYVMVRNCRVGVTNGNATATYTVTNETNQQGTVYLKVRSEKGGELISIVSDSWKETSIRHQYVTKAGEQEYEALGWMNGYVLTFTAPASVEVLELGFRPSGYDTKATGSVVTDNDILNQIYREAYDTLYICMRDTYMDCPDRERSQWWGDTVSNMQQATYAMDENAALLYTKTLKQVIGFVKRDGALPSKVANGKDDLELPMQSLAGVHSFWQYYLYSGNEELLFEAYPYLLDYLEMWTVSTNGVISHRVGNWDWFDWGDNPDMAVIENCWYYVALESVLNIAELEGSGATAAEIELLKSRMDRIAKNFDAIYWDESKNAYYSETANGKADDRANALAVYTGLADKSRYSGILNVLTTTYNASPYMEKYVLESMYLMDAADEAVARTILRYTPLAEDGYPTLPEYWVMRAGGTNNHAWTGGPLSMLYMYNAGITPITPEFKTFRVRPQLGTLTEVNAYTVQGCGKIEVIAKRGADGYTLTLVVPDGADGALICIPRIEGGNTEIVLGNTVLYRNGMASASLPSGISYAGEDVNYVNFLVSNGTYTFASREGEREVSDTYSFVIGEIANGTVTVNGTTVTSFPYTYTAASGSKVTVVITPVDGYRLVALTGSDPETLVTESSATRVYTLEGDKCLNAVIEKAALDYRSLTVSISDKDMARYALTAYINGDTVTLPYKSVYEEGTRLTLSVDVAGEHNYAVTINGENVRTLDITVSSDITVDVDIKELDAVTEHAVSSVTVSKKSSNDTTWDEKNLYDGIRVSATDSLGYSTGFGSSTASVSITYDLGSVKRVNQIALFPRTDMSALDTSLCCNYPVDFMVLVSTDGSSYTTALTVRNCANPKFKQQSFALDAVYEARYVRLTVTKVGLPISGETSTYLQLAELDVYYNAILAGEADIPVEPPIDPPVTPPVDPAYPEIPAEYADTNKYPFAVFMDGAFVGAYTHWSNTDDKDLDNGGSADNLDAIQQAKALIHGADGKGKTVYILLRRSYALDSTEYAVKDGTKVNENYGNYSQVGGTLVVDLGGYTLTLGAEKFITANAKATSSVAHDSAFEFKNGTIELNSQAMIYYQSHSSLTASKNFDFVFKGVTFVLPANIKGASIISQGSFSGTANVFAKVDFIDCTFDYSRATAANSTLTLFDVNDAELDATVTVKGGKIIANGDSFAALTTSSLGKLGELTFTPDDSGNYTSLYMEEGNTVTEKAFPTSKGDKYFILIGSAAYGNENYDMYVLAEKAFGDYAPQMSITLENSLTVNVYVPVMGTVKFIFNGTVYESLADLDTKTVNEKEYYVVSVSLPASEAAKAIELAADVNMGTDTLSFGYTFSIPEYASKVLIDPDMSAAAKTLVLDTLAYIRAAYVYFDSLDKASATALIDGILGDYSKVAEITEGGTSTAGGICGVAIMLKGSPVLRFIIADGTDIGAYTFSIDGTPIAYTTGTMALGGNTYTYAEVLLSARHLIKEITYTNGTDSGSYHISSYYTFVTTAEEHKDNASLITLVEKLYNYAKAAEDYRASVTAE